MIILTTWRDPVADVDLVLSHRDNDNLDNLPPSDQLLTLNLNSTQTETKQETDFSTEISPTKTGDDVTGDCDIKPGVSGGGSLDNSTMELFRSDSEPNTGDSIISTFEPGWSSSSPQVRARSASDLDPRTPPCREVR